jgi:toxin-antitoxin system PIN domain toxin
MKLLDVNLLVYATNKRLPENPLVAAWFDDLMNSGERVAIPWHSLTGFLRVATRSSGHHPLAMRDALEFFEDWLEWDTVWVPTPTEEHPKILARLLTERPQSRLVPDAHLAALAIEYNLTLCSTDSDFRVFNGLKFLNPLE